ncbi:ribose-5-phosphate isomerase RpiA [Oceanobacillus massiliensis]|uniref:ribose-5-phosphate isomerase RpiA n=1 Tax=Oceanobacillus massiliensis TaxID=1465765 RepID=UPI000287E09C|nr:ribose-5-phosphate isomerase RpiA [Oceanobacillus massiliensis]
MLSEMDQMKRAVGEEAAAYVKDGMKIGLGTGSTAYWLIRRLGERVKSGLNIEGIPSSAQTEQWAKEFGVPLTDFSRVKELDITIDGADEVDENLHLIKGGGAALFREKIIAQAANELIIIVDSSKMVTNLGKYPLPVEVLPFGWERTANEISMLGCVPNIRKKDGGNLITDNGNYILDCPFDAISDPARLNEEIRRIIGVVETGLFIGMADKILVGNGKEIKVIQKNKAV